MGKERTLFPSGRSFPLAFGYPFFSGNICSRGTGRCSVDRRGFALTELLLAVGVLLLVGALALPTVWRVGQAMRLDGEAARLAAAIMKHRETIMSRQAIDSGFPSASGETEPFFTLTATEYFIRIGTARKERHALPAGITMEPGQPTARFLPNGSATPMTIRMSAGGEVRYVIVDVAGRVRVSPDPPKS